MIYRSEAIPNLDISTSADSLADIPFSCGDSLDYVVATCHICCDSRRECAAGAVNIFSIDCLG